jgi:hypothetical protein
MRFAEIALISLPVLLALAWVMGLRHASYRIFLVIALGLAALGAGMILLGEQRSFTGHYTPARLENGRVVPEHGA